VLAWYGGYGKAGIDAEIAGALGDFGVGAVCVGIW
jgi:hypothetical protein